MFAWRFLSIFYGNSMKGDVPMNEVFLNGMISFMVTKFFQNNSLMVIFIHNRKSRA